MNIGDKVRAIHSIEEGIVTKVIDEKIVEIETADGFSMPFVKSELVVVVKDENSFFRKEDDESLLKSRKSGKKNVDTSSPIIEEITLVQNKGIFISFIQVTQDLHELYVINNTELDLLVHFAEEKNNQQKTLFIDKIGAKKAEKMNQYHLSQFENWPKFSIQFLMGKKRNSDFFPPMAKTIRFKASTFYKAKGKAPIIQKDGFIFQIDKDNLEIEPKDIVKAMQEKTSAEKVITPIRTKSLVREHQEIDLHIEKLTDDIDFLNANEIFSIQMNTFEKEFENALSENRESITFIHGVGNGTLRHEIHKKVSKHSDIAFFEDANKEKFGYGATFIKFK